MTETLLHVDRVTAGYDGSAVLRDIDIQLAAGQVLAVLGANGAGKTTLLRAISGLLTPMQGAISVLGRPADTRRPHKVARWGVAHVSEGRSVFYGLTVAEHMRLKPRGEKLDVELAYHYFPRLKELSGRRAGLLSGGEQQMLALARTLMGDPDLILVDEPTEGLAPKIVELVASFLVALRERGIAVLLIEQKLTIALTVSQRCCVMGHGAIVFDGTPERLKADAALRREWLEV